MYLSLNLNFTFQWLLQGRKLPGCYQCVLTCHPTRLATTFVSLSWNTCTPFTNHTSQPKEGMIHLITNLFIIYTLKYMDGIKGDRFLHFGKANFPEQNNGLEKPQLQWKLALVHQYTCMSMYTEIYLYYDDGQGALSVGNTSI